MNVRLIPVLLALKRLSRPPVTWQGALGSVLVSLLLAAPAAADVGESG